MKGGVTMKAILIKGIELPENNGVLDLRIYHDYASMMCGSGSFSSFKVEQVEIPDEEEKSKGD